MRLTVVGAGYVGLTTAVCFSKIGHFVNLVEVSEERIRTLLSGVAPFFEPSLDELLKEVLAQRLLRVTSNLEASVSDSDIIFIAVGTPDHNGAIDLSQVKEAAAAIAKCLKPEIYHTVIVKSTVIPGTTDGVVRETLEQVSGLKAGQFGLCMNPEFLREGSAVKDFMDPDRIVIGQWDDRAGQLAKSLYANFDCPVICTTLRNAELIKYSSNSLLSVLISFSNEIASICEQLPETDVETVMQALHLDRRLSPVVEGKRVSPQILSYLRAGCGFGGSCLPKDVNALRAFSKDLGIATPLLDATVAVNVARGKQVIDLLEKSIGCLRGKKIGVLGLTFKPETDDLRESSALKMIDHLEAKQAQVHAYDPQVKTAVPALGKRSFVICQSAKEAYQSADALVIATAWEEFKSLNWQEIAREMRNPVILDGRRLLSVQNIPENIILQPIGVAKLI
jgi:UDPglucose 6-dehydrogenase/GDP-mannose 6-dehydrogenase